MTVCDHILPDVKHCPGHWSAPVLLIEYVKETEVKSLNGIGMAGAAKTDGLTKLVPQPSNKF